MAVTYSANQLSITAGGEKKKLLLPGLPALATMQYLCKHWHWQWRYSGIRANQHQQYRKRYRLRGFSQQVGGD